MAMWRRDGIVVTNISSKNSMFIHCTGRKRCPWPTNEKFADAVFDCPQDKFESGYVLSGNTCYLTCGSGRPGGKVTCQEDGSFDAGDMYCA